jgi:L-2-hydroxyglutarate oxidase LhgO
VKIDIDTTVIGAGVVGLAVAAEIAAAGRGVYLLEKNERFGQETSSRNSEVIHAGIYYPAGSLKARLCTTGNRMLTDFCRQARIPHRICGKLIVATDTSEEEALEAIEKRAADNGVSDLQRLTADQVRRREPRVTATAALWSPSTGIVDSHRLMRVLAARGARSGVQFVPNCRVTGVAPAQGGCYRLKAVYPDGAVDELTTRRVVNCAGLQADRIAAAMGIDIDAEDYRQHYWKGAYFGLAPTFGALNHLVYPVPMPNNEGLGIHATIDLSGRSKLGPDASYLPHRDLDYTVDPGGRKAFHRAAKRYLRGLAEADLTPEMAGIRPKRQRPGDPVKDFLIREESGRGLPGVVNLVGIESPGLTACLAIAKEVRGLLASD